MGGGYGMPCLYAVLGVTRDASAADVRTAYLREALKYQPDKQSTQSDYHRAKEEANTIRFQQIKKAYQVLSNASRRAAYDAIVFPSFEPELVSSFQRMSMADSRGEIIIRDLTDKMIQQVHRIKQLQHPNLNMDEVLAKLEGIKRRSSSFTASHSDMGATSSAGPQAAVIHGAGGKQSMESSSATSHLYSPFSRRG